MKKLFTLLLAVMMVFSLAATAFASSEGLNGDRNGTFNEDKGSITITGISTGVTYSVYRMLDLQSFDTAGDGKYSYTVNENWVDFFNGYTSKAMGETKATDFVNLEISGGKTFVTWKETVADTDAATLARLAMDYVDDKDIDPIATSTSATFITETDENDVLIGKFSELNLGYYLVDTTMGALCGLTTTNFDAYLNPKNGVPTIDKQVKEDSTSQWGAHNTADIGQTVEYRVTIDVPAGAQNYVLHDTMDEGLTFLGVTDVQHVDTSENKTETATAGENADYVVVTEGLRDGYTFEVRFTRAFCDHLEANDKVVIHYNAMLNRNAEIAGDGNYNTAILTYGETHESNEDEVYTLTYGFDVIKTDSQDNLIDGAKFRIYDAAQGGNEVDVVILEAEKGTEDNHLIYSDKTAVKFDFDGDGVEDDDGWVSKVKTYRRARANEEGVEIIVTDGRVRLVGFDNGTYFLHEVEAPSGYNTLTAREKFVINNGNLDATFTNGVYSTGSGVHVVNKTGTRLPETGAMGTSMFITFGMLVVLGTGVLLVTKKRMSMIED